MKCFVKYIGIIDKKEKVHCVSLQPGMNIITGKSSTGKSALIEIFDYCFGSSDYTVPVGVITDHAKLYFTVLRFENKDLVLGRIPNSKKGFIKEIDRIEESEEKPNFKVGFFEEILFIPLANFRKELGRYFGLTITDVDTDLEERFYRSSKSPTPSVRSFTSFMLQHQNLVANKHAIFYRFDEKEKKEQAIEHLKIFLGFADQNYFLLSQKLNSLSVEIRKREILIPKKKDAKEKITSTLTSHLREYAVHAGTQALDASPGDILNNPGKWLERVRQNHVSLDSSSDEYSRQRSELSNERDTLVKEIRGLERQKLSVESSIRFSENYLENISKLNYPINAKEYASSCPFCNQESHIIENEANQLSKAIEWLNKELRRSPYLSASFESEAQQLAKRIEKNKVVARGLDLNIEELDSQIEQINENKSIYEMALKSKLKLEIFLGQLIEAQSTDIDSELVELKQHLATLKKEIGAYKIEEKLSEAQSFIDREMSSIGKRLDFEDSFRPINLKFDFYSFDLWHEKDDAKVFLRSMGSGANWLYCHLTLFMALHKLFCKIGKNCKIPPILFLDQPTQVYFPNITSDIEEKFIVRELVSKSKKQAQIDDDIKSVERFFSEIINFCSSTLEETGIEPQVIITDHADNLKLEDGKVFNDYVKARWRIEKFIKVPDPD